MAIIVSNVMIAWTPAIPAGVTRIEYLMPNLMALTQSLGTMELLVFA